MAFENEFASYKPLARVLNNEKIDALAKKMKVLKYTKTPPVEYPGFIDVNALSESNPLPELIVSIDGSYQPVTIDNGFPGAEMGYVTVAAVLTDMRKQKELIRQAFPNPKELRETEKLTSFDAVYPGCNVVIDGEDSARCSLRRYVYEQMMGSSEFTDFESLLKTYEALLAYRLNDFKATSHAPKHQLEDLEDSERMEYGMERFSSVHEAANDAPLYSTDALRLHELLNPAGSSGELFGQISFVMERLYLVHVLRAFERKGWLPMLKQVAFVLDGSLVVYSVSAWLSKAIEKEIQRINRLQKEINGTDLIIIGVEKTGRFVEHFNTIDTAASGELGIFPRRSALLLDDAYIKKNIIFSNSTKPYGEATYFGRKFFYKTSNGYRLVAQTACLTEAQSDLTTAKPEQFPRLADVCRLLDSFVSNRYPNSISPLVSAHAEASIPLNLGQKIFEKIAEDIRKKG